MEAHKRIVGFKQYELANHLGNVIDVVTDKKKPVDANTDGTTDYYEPTVHMASAYYPFGMQMSGLNYQGPDYRFGFQGQEKDDEWHGATGTVYDYGARMYDPALGRFHTQDRFAVKYYGLSPYQYAANNPIKFIDVNGDSLYVHHQGRTLKYENGTYYNSNGSAVALNKRGKVTGKGRSFFNQTSKSLKNIEGTTRGNELVDGIASNEENDVLIVKATDGGNGYTPDFEDDASNFVGTGGIVEWNNSYKNGGPNTSGGTSRPIFIGLAHELAHAEDAINRTVEIGTTSFDINPDPTAGNYVSVKNAEKYATHVENIIRGQASVKLRSAYRTVPFNGGSRPVMPLLKNGNESIYYPGHKYITPSK